ncbi:MAG: hypothetical protein FWG14_13355 [Peptococcaceae bacterium]|nr:hypothetical protein [Peptococcaceae bacterium]
MIYYRVRIPHREGWKYFRTEEEAGKYGAVEVVTLEDKAEIDMIEVVLAHDEKEAALEREWIEKYKDL